MTRHMVSHPTVVRPVHAHIILAQNCLMEKSDTMSERQNEIEQLLIPAEEDAPTRNSRKAGHQWAVILLIVSIMVNCAFLYQLRTPTSQSDTDTLCATATEQYRRLTIPCTENVD